MTKKTKAILVLTIALGGAYLYSKMSPAEKEKFRKSFKKSGTNYLIQLLSFGLGQALPGNKRQDSGTLAPEPLAQASGQSNAIMDPQPIRTIP